MDKRRKINGHDSPFSNKLNDDDDNLTVEEHHLDITLSLSSYAHRHPPPPPPPPPPSLPHLNLPSPLPDHLPAVSAQLPRRARRNPIRSQREGKSDTVPIPYPWATDQRATIHSLSYLRSNKITTISGDVQCKKCDLQFTLEFDLNEKFNEIGGFIFKNKESMRQRAATEWQTPILPKCTHCDNENSVRPVIADKKKAINWLFMLLGQMLGFCTLDQLKYFCKHTKNHRTGAKDRVLYLTYLNLCKQLEPIDLFDP